jgi:hypothetical protein
VATWRDLAARLKALRDLARQLVQSQSRRAQRSDIPPIPPVPPKGNGRNSQPDDEYDDVELLGRNASYDEQSWQNVQANEVRVVSSSNVYSYYFEPETPSAGILYVTFLHWEKGMKSTERSGPGATYAYYNVPHRKYEEFRNAAATSAGTAVWDYLRVRGTVHEHQNKPELIQVAGDYVPRKATARGFADRTLISPGMSPSSRRATFRRSQSRANHPAGQFFKRSTLNATPGAGRIRRNGQPNRGEPNRGTPNRGEPNRGN